MAGVSFEERGVYADTYPAGLIRGGCLQPGRAGMAAGG